jgi:hypothetical protein
LALGALLTATSISAFQPTVAQTPYLLPYYSPNLGLSVEYPSDWNSIEGNSMVIFVSPPTSNFDSHPERLLISVIPNTNMPIRQTADSIPYTLQTSLTDFVLLLSEPITINGNIAHQYVYTFNDQYFGPTIALDIVMTNGYNTYGLSYYAEPSNYEFYLPTINTMINSLQTSAGSVSAASPSLETDVDASSMLNILGDEAEVSPYVAEGLSNMVEIESLTNDQIIANMN